MTRQERDLDRLEHTLPPAVEPRPYVRRGTRRAPKPSPTRQPWRPSCEAVLSPQAARGFTGRVCGRPSQERLRGLSVCGRHAAHLRSKTG